ncbi:myb/SANT-like DNA-binding domain-containing protein 1 [Dermacentor albipictus]|uniref:myb/SANT-like DNA-binding domain-containing protein 1 n=1 Tax=Dermacentor albipictus TaxID=60249 RepID=UPI0038FC8756
MATASGTDEQPPARQRKPRVQWSERDTWALIKLWEDNLPSLRAQKHNGGVYDGIAQALTSMGVPRTKAQVHSKIENLGQTYRSCLKHMTTGSSPPSWPFFSEVHRFLGSLPVHDTSLMEEAGCSESTTSSTASVEELIFDMLDSGSASCEDVAEDCSPSESPVQRVESRNLASGSSECARRKRRQPAGDFQERMLEEQRRQREQFADAHKMEMDLRKEGLKLQEKLVDAMLKFFSKN